MGAGIAGVGVPADYKGEGILIIKERSKYREWEFIYDPQKDKQIPNPNATGAGGTPAQQLGTPAGGRGPGNGVGQPVGGGLGGIGGGVGQPIGGGTTPPASTGNTNSFGSSNSFNPAQTPTTPKKQ